MAKTKTPKASINVDIVSDIVCPWCWLGVKMFEKAAKQTKHDIQLSWRPYMLDPSVPESGLEYKDCLLYTSPSPRDATLSRMPSSA